MEPAILPLGSFEQHGPHLPLGTDIYIVEALARGIAEALGAYLLPVQPFSTCYEHFGKRGSVTLPADVFYRFIVNIAERLHAKGFDQILILPGHGGIFVLDPAIAHLRASCPALFAARLDPINPPVFPADMDTEGIHADDMETSLMLYLHPDLVHMDRAVDCIPSKPRLYLNYGSIFNLSPSGVWGRPTKATKQKGKLLYDQAVADAVVRARELLKGGER